MADARTAAAMNGKRAFAARISKRSHVAVRRDVASMYLPNDQPQGFGQSAPQPILQVLTRIRTKGKDKNYIESANIGIYSDLNV
jgi:hypothetical protein